MNIKECQIKELSTWSKIEELNRQLIKTFLLGQFSKLSHDGDDFAGWQFVSVCKVYKEMCHYGVDIFPLIMKIFSEYILVPNTK